MLIRLGIAERFLVVMNLLVCLVIPDVPVCGENDVPEANYLLRLESVSDKLREVACEWCRCRRFLRKRLGVDFRENGTLAVSMTFARRSAASSVDGNKQRIGSHATTNATRQS